MRTRGPRWLVSGLVAGGIALALTASMAAVPALAEPAGLAGRQALPTYVPMWSETSGGSATADLGPAAANAPVQARVYLAGRDSRGLAAYATDVSTPGDPLFHHYLTPAQVQSRFGPTVGQVATVEAWLRQSGLRVTGATSHYVTVAGTAAQAQAAFDAVWHSYTVAGEVQQSPPPDATMSAPDAVAGAVLTVVPTEIGPPGSRPPSPTRPSAVAQPCSEYFGQRPATDLPQAYGETAPYAACAYTPQQLRSAYGVPAELTGEGVTVAVVHPSHETTAASDLAAFGARNGEPLRPGQFTELLPADLDASCPNGAIRAGGTSINQEEVPDVETVHAMAPDAAIDYLGTECDDDLGTLSGLDALTEIVDERLASIVSNSWSPTSLSSGVVSAFDDVLEQGAAEGVGFYFGAGQVGAGGGAASRVGFNADPWVTAVGGTTLAVGPRGNYEWETGLGDDAAPLASDGTNWTSLPGSLARGGGGGTSSLFTQPAYQRGVVPASLSHVGGSSQPMRVIPDISADSDPATPILSGGAEPAATGKPGPYTDFPSAGANTIALVAGLQADAQQAEGTPIGFANPAIYVRAGTPAYHDVTDQPLGPGVALDAVVPAGSDSFGAPSTPELITFGHDEGRSATPGYDAVTGVGTPTVDYFMSRKSARL